jgi:uroporphyrin-3 C-methyltransferase
VNTEIPDNKNEISQNHESESPPADPAPAAESAPPPPEPAADMKTDNADSQPPAAAPRPERRGGGTFLALLAFLLAAAAAAGVAWLWWQGQSAEGAGEEQLQRDIASLESKASEQSQRIDALTADLASLDDRDLRAQVEALQRRLETDRSELSQAEKASGEQLALSRSLQAAAESMQHRLAAVETAVQGLGAREIDAGGAMDLAEVDFLLRLANERLKLFRDPASADQALEIADMHLAALDNPLYLGVRQDIASARQALGRVTLPDYPALDAELDAIQALVPRLPFPGEPVGEALDQTAGEDDGWWAKVKRVFSSLVTVRRSSGPDSERLSLTDKDLIRQRLWLQLEAARVALARRDQAGFSNALKRSGQSLAQWFDESDSSYQAARDRIDHLSDVAIEVEVPDITAPWSTLRLLRTGPAAAAATAIEPEPEPAAEAVQPQAAESATAEPAAVEPEMPAQTEEEEPASGDSGA